MKHILSVLVENHPGVLSRVSGLFSRRGFNIDSLAVGTTDNPQRSRVTVVVTGDSYVVEQVTKQLNKLVDIVSIDVLNLKNTVVRELVLVKVSVTSQSRTEVLQISDIFRTKVVDIGPDAMVFEVTGDCSKVQAFMQMLEPYGILEVVRTGSVAIARGSKTIYDNIKEDFENENVL